MTLSLSYQKVFDNHSLAYNAVSGQDNDRDDDLANLSFYYDKMKFRLIGYVLLLSIGFMLGLAGNMLIVYVLLFRWSTRSSFTYLSSGLALYQMLKCLLILPPLLYVTASLTMVRVQHEVSHLLCQAYRASVIFFTVNTSLIMLLTAWDRLSQVSKPWRITFVSHVLAQFAAIFVLSSALAIPAFLLYGVAEEDAYYPTAKANASRHALVPDSDHNGSSLVHDAQSSVQYRPSEKHVHLIGTFQCTLKYRLKGTLPVNAFVLFFSFIYVASVLAMVAIYITVSCKISYPNPESAMLRRGTRSTEASIYNADSFLGHALAALIPSLSRHSSSTSVLSQQEPRAPVLGSSAFAPKLKMARELDQRLETLGITELSKHETEYQQPAVKKARKKKVTKSIFSFTRWSKDYGSPAGKSSLSTKGKRRSVLAENKPATSRPVYDITAPETQNQANLPQSAKNQQSRFVRALKSIFRFPGRDRNDMADQDSDEDSDSVSLRTSGFSHSVSKQESSQHSRSQQSPDISVASRYGSKVADLLNNLRQPSIAERGDTRRLASQETSIHVFEFFSPVANQETTKEVKEPVKVKGQEESKERPKPSSKASLANRVTPTTSHRERTQESRKNPPAKPEMPKKNGKAENAHVMKASSSTIGERITVFAAGLRKSRVGGGPCVCKTSNNSATRSAEPDEGCKEEGSNTDPKETDPHPQHQQHGHHNHIINDPHQKDDHNQNNDQQPSQSSPTNLRRYQSSPTDLSREPHSRLHTLVEASGSLTHDNAPQLVKSSEVYEWITPRKAELGSRHQLMRRYNQESRGIIPYPRTVLVFVLLVWNLLLSYVFTIYVIVSEAFIVDTQMDGGFINTRRTMEMMFFYHDLANPVVWGLLNTSFREEIREMFGFSTYASKRPSRAVSTHSIF